LPLGNAGVAALPDHPAHVGGVDAHRVVGLVADIEMGFVDRLDLRADAAVPQQIDGRTGWRGSAPAMSTPASSRRVGESERPAGGGERNGLGGAVPHSPPALMRAASWSAQDERGSKNNRRRSRNERTESGFGSRKMYR
jgi:hypothetical protein